VTSAIGTARAYRGRREGQGYTRAPVRPLFDEHEQVVICHEPEVGLRAIIAIHDTTLGPALGGIRMWRYERDEDALTDVLRLARGMTYKNALAGLNLGGGKTVVLGDPRTDKHEMLFRALGRFIDSLGGRYLAAEDVGTSTADAEVVAVETRHITGLPVDRGGSGDPSPMTAWGVVCGMRAALAEAEVGDGLEGVRVAVQGAGRVGAEVVRHLLEARAHVTVADIYPDRVEPLRALGAQVGDPARIHAEECDVYSPCALGAVIRPDTIDQLRCRVIAGAANNQLLDDAMGDALVERGILYAPDFVVNAGGVINIADELSGGGYRPERARRAVERIAGTLEAVFARARADGIPPHRAADRMAEERLGSARPVTALYRPR
jgi:leucine dehydrogenase